MNNNSFLDTACHNTDDEHKMDLICSVYVKSASKTSVTRISLPLMLIYGFKITQLGFDCCQATTLIDLYTWTFTKGQCRQPSVVSRLESSMSRLFLCFPYVMRSMKYESS